MGTRLDTEAANNPTEIGQCTECQKVATVIESTDGELLQTGTDGACSGCGNDTFVIVGG